MKNTLVFATHNPNKAIEVDLMLSEFEVKSLINLGYHKEIEEIGSTFRENAEIKAKTIYDKFKLNVFADDSGLVIPSLNDEPGVYSARYAGTGNSLDNIEKVLNNLKNSTQRDAYFITSICLIFKNETYFFEGKIEGEILTEMKGENGFGYDPIFKPNGYNKSFSEFSKEEKNAISHRSIAIQKMYDFLKKQI